MEGAGFSAPKPTPSPFSSGLSPASPLRPSYMRPLLRCSLGFLLMLLPFSLPCQWVCLSASVLGRCHKPSAFWLDIGVWQGVGMHTEEASPDLSLPTSCLAHSAVPPPPSSSDHAHIWRTGCWSVCGSGWEFACKYKYICTPRAFRPRIPWLALHTWA